MKKLLELILVLTLLIPASAHTDDDIKKLDEEKLANEQSKKKNNEGIVFRVNCWSKEDGYPDPERAKLYGKELYFIIDTKQNTVERFYQEGQDEIKQTLFNIVEINEKKVIYQAELFNPYKNMKMEVKYEFYYGGRKTSYGDISYTIFRLKPEGESNYIACSPKYHSIEVLTEIDNNQSYKDAFIEKRINVEKNFEKELLGNCFSGGFRKKDQLLKNYLGYALELISIYNFETDMSKNNINYCNWHQLQFKPKTYTKSAFDINTSDARIKWGGGQSIQIDNITYKDGKIFAVSIIDLSKSYNCLQMIFIDTKINEDNFLMVFLELNDGRHISSLDDPNPFLANYCN
tara:strand:+ start:326 stop:1363 length:1038 start_codon:yes stop_codon:yes gene_type:complete